MMADPYGGSASAAVPQSWTRYAYSSHDPATFADPSGLDSSDPFDYPCSVGAGEDVETTTCEVYTFRVSGFARISLFGRALQRLGAAEDAIEARESVSPKCQQDLDALSRAAGKEISLATIQEALANTDFENGVISTLPVSALWGPAAVAGASFQNNEDKMYGPGQTIANEFARNPAGLTAATVFEGSTIFINPALIGGLLFTNESLLFHEALHELGMIDSQIQTALKSVHQGLVVDTKNTKNISVVLGRDCLRGKGNN